MKWISVSFILLFAAVAIAQAPSPIPPTASPGVAVPLNRWLVVRESAGKGLKKGDGVRFRPDGFDSASAGKGSVNGTTCTPAADELVCENGLKAKALAGGEVKATLGSIVLTMAPATVEESAAFSKWVADTTAQQAACLAAAQCCGAAEGPLGQTCDLNKTLGDRSFASCTAALANVRAALQAKKLPLPEACR